MTKKLIYIFIFLVLTGSNVFSQEKSSGYLISGGLYLNGNIYNSKFNQLPGNQTNITSFEDAFGIGWTAYGGIEWRPGTTLFGSDFGISIGLAYSDLSANFDKEEFIGHIISPDTFTDGIVRHNLETDFKAVLIEPELIFYPFSEMPVSFLAGFQVGFPLTTKYSQTEQIISPDNIAFNDEGDRIRQSVSGELPEASSFYFALSAGARYKAMQFGRFELNPEIKFNYGLTDMVSAIDWKTHSVRAGITVNYDLPKPAKMPPAAPPMPLMPEPPLPKAPGRLELATNVTVEGKEINDGDTVSINKIVTKSVSEHEINPVFFFEKNSSEPLNSFIYGGIDSYSFSESVAKAAGNNNITISAYSTDDEPVNIAINRAEYLKNMLEEAGINNNNISTKLVSIEINKLKHPELSDEYRKAEINISGNKLLKYKNEFIMFEDFYRTLITVDSKIYSDEQKIEFNGLITTNTGFETKFNNENYSFDIAANMPINSFNISTSVTDADNQSVENRFSFPIKEVTLSEETQINRTEDNKYEEHILAYFEFNETESYAVNDFAIKRAKDALSNGKKVILLPLTDNFGTPEYNDKLASSRAGHALKILGRSNEIEIVKPENYIFPNDNPYGRMMNRTVMVRIEVE